MAAFLVVALGGALGAAARYGTSVWLTPLTGANAWATFAVNMTGALALGALAGLLEQRTSIDPLVRLALVTGVIGGFTTFSTWMFEIVSQAEHGALLASTLNLAGSVVLGLVAVVVGLAIGRAIG